MTEEQFLVEHIKELQRAYLEAAQPYAARLAHLRSLQIEGQLVLRVAPDGCWKRLEYEDLWTNVPQMDQRPPEGGR